jgi:PKD repeat protein
MIASLKSQTVLILFLTSQSITFSQPEFSKWYFGVYAGLDFSTNPPIALTNGTMVAPEGCASVSDAGGNLLFYTNGVEVFNNTHTTMANGLGLNSDLSSSQSALIVKKPSSNSLYYVFTVWPGTGFYYSIVDMSLAAGLGSVTAKNVPLNSSSTEKQVAVRHCNGRDIWILGHELNINHFWAYLLTANGVNTVAVTSVIGNNQGDNAGSAIGHLKISPDGRLLASATSTASVPASLGDRGFHLFNFDASSGVVSNSLTLLLNPSLQRPYSVEFSPDGTKLYGSAMSATNTGGTIYQWDVCQSATAAIVGSMYSFTVPSSSPGSIQRSIDSRLYLTSFGSTSLSVIDNPNNAGASMNFSLNAVSLGGKQGRLGLPNWVNPYDKPVVQPISSSVACQTASFTSPVGITFTGGCSPVTHSYTSYIWYFGEPSSGSANSSTLSNPIHSYQSLGTFTVKLLLFSNCTSDTVIKIVTISAADPAIAITGQSTICKGEQRTFFAIGGSNYLWGDNSTSFSITLSPTVTSVYGLTASASGCTVKKSFTVTVNDCVDQQDLQNFGMTIFPVPFREELNVESSYTGKILLYTLEGKKIFTREVSIGVTRIKISGLPAGMYVLRGETFKGVWHKRIIKTD